MTTEFIKNTTDLDRLILRGGGFAKEGFQPVPQLKDFVLNHMKILIVGAGGLGCEILKNMAILGFKNLHIIDLDSIDVTNLNRQFLFRQKDVGRYKSEVAAEFVMKRVRGVEISHHVGKIQDKDMAFYSQFQIIIAGLDNIEARRWLNSLIFSFIEYNEDGSIKPQSKKILIDGGTESFGGQSRVVIPGDTPCFECTLGTMTKSNKFNFCTISQTPRIPEHCIAYAYLILWDQEFPNKKIDTDSADDMTWIFERALERAKEFGIEGVTYMLTMGVVKNIIPAIASTNATIAASCCNEALKISSYIAPNVENYMMYMGQTGVNIQVMKFEPLENCPICSNNFIDITVKKSDKISELVEKVETQFNVKKITLSCEDGKYLYAAQPAQLYEKHKHKMDLTFEEMIEQGLYVPGVKVYVFAKSLPSEIKLKIVFEE